MKKKSASQSAFFNLRVSLAFTLCSVGALLATLSLWATPPVETTRANTSMPPDPANFPSTFGSNANRLPRGVPLPPGAQFSLNRQGDPSSSSPTAGFPGFAGMPLRPRTASGANPLGNPGFANQQPAPLSVPQPAAPESMPLPSGAQSGDWSIVSSPNTSATQNNDLFGVACVSASDCWAVGDYSNNNSIPRTLIEHWDGTSWAIVSSPNTSTTDRNFLTGVTCASASECWAVGYYYNGNIQTLIERWDGTSWAIVSSPNPAPNSYLNDVTCVSASDCWAVGYYYNGSAYQTLIERWDGTSWAIISSLNPAENNYLKGVTCVSASECWAVGFYYNGILPVQTLIERWDGTSWAIVASPNTSATQDNFLFPVTCVSASECWAVGNYYNGSAAQTLIERWDGTSWAIVTSPNTSATQENDLYGVTCGSASECWAVGYYYTGNFTPQTLIERWDGTSWAIVSSPNTSATQANFLQAVKCVSASECWAVGDYSASFGTDQTLVLRYTAPLQLTAAVSRKTHGGAGTFDVPLPLTGAPGVECRNGGAANDYTMVVTFSSNVTVTGNPQAEVTLGTGCVGSAGTCSGNVSVNSDTVTIPLTNIANAQTINVRINSVNGTGIDTPATDFTIPMSILIGDTNANATVNAGDVAQTKGRLGQTIDATNFRSDVNANGSINASDVAIVKQNSGTSLPP